MLRTRLVVGSLLACAGVAILFVDTWFAPWYPILFVAAIAITFALAYELQHLLPEMVRPRSSILFGCMLLIILANWSKPIGLPGSALMWIGAVIAVTLLITFLAEAWAYREPGNVTQRIALTFLSLVYIGLFSSYLIQLRWGWGGKPAEKPGLGTIALLLAIFVPKCCDIGAYFTGRLIGKHQMTPLLSPKKTWEGAAGGLILASLTALFITHGLATWLSLDSTERPEFPLRLSQIVGISGWAWSLIFGFVIGLMGMLGDLMESMIKRDLKQKDAASTVPGFGGLLDVFDSILFSAPITYFFLPLLTVLTYVTG